MINLDIFSMIATILTGICGLFILTNMVFRFLKNENTNIKEEIENVVKDIQNQPDYDVFKLLYKNVRESTEYYIISKRQANKSFILATVSCVLGVFIYICGFLIVAFLDKNITILTTISGTVVELIAGLSFWMYNKSLKQLNEYHRRLSSTEKYLTAIQMADKLKSSEKNWMYRFIIEKVMLADPDNYMLKQNNNNTQ